MCPVSSRGFQPATTCTNLTLEYISRSLAHYEPKKARGGGRRAQQQQQASSSSRQPAVGSKRTSRLARENDVSAAEEADIKEAFRLFAVKDEGFAGGKEDVIPVEDVRRAMIALSLPPTSAAELRTILTSLDPTNTGFATYPSFLTVCALKLRARTTTPKAIEEAIDAAFRLFTNGDNEGPITMAHLRRVARELKEDVGEEVLRDMILEANGGASVSRGVGREDFEGVMRRAGVF
ncbi:hypothetical protein FGG08_000279 [Glutinoglossum americanum]|uniref:Calmodulin n=1 Tax=Glutinoglossum americanum TaxID=1670608 RepID=A0A9P8IDI8_9PEZI|nr:hypothetical protein FGG08_000279 [Glutinoglossum americanum]